MSAMFFDGWQPILRTIIVGVLAYPTLVATLRLSGKRTLAKMNAFDFVITVALGSTLATLVISKEVALAQGVVALMLLVALQWIVAFAAVRSKLVDNLVKSEPQLLVHHGALLSNAMRAERVTVGELMSALRQEGLASAAEADAVVLETDGSISVVPRFRGVEPHMLDDLSGREARGAEA